MTRSHGRSPRGLRLHDAVPYGRWKTSTFVAGLRQNGLVAPAVFNGAINGQLFLVDVEQVLIPTLRPGRRTGACFRPNKEQNAPGASG